MSQIEYLVLLLICVCFSMIEQSDWNIQAEKSFNLVVANLGLYYL